MAKSRTDATRADAARTDADARPDRPAAARPDRPASEHRNAFAPFSWKVTARELGRRRQEAIERAETEEEALAAGQLLLEADEDAHTTFYWHPPRANRIIALLMVASLFVTAVQLAVEIVASGQDFLSLLVEGYNTSGVYAIVYYVFTAAVVVLLSLVIHFDHKQEITRARMIIRAVVGLLVVGLLLHILMTGMSWSTLFYVVQFACVLSYQVYNDPNLSRPPRFVRPGEGRAARANYERDPDRRGYIPMNFFNLFWVFMVGSVIGLVLETMYMLLTTGVWKDRTCMLWGPFSPIYGVGAVLMTVAVNRWWYCNGSIIFVVTGVVGAALEFFVSWFLETAFGVYSWDYTGAFLSIDGRTDFAHFCAWGFLGVMWVRLLLPTIMRVVDAIPLRWRASVTCAVMAFMVVNASLTVMALDCWSQRLTGEPVESATQQFFAEHFDDDYMAEHFATLKLVE